MNSKDTTNRYIQEITSAKITKRNKINKIYINHNFIDGAFVEISGSDDDEKYEVSFYNNNNNELIHRATIECNHWTRTNRKYYTDWRIEVKKNDGELIFSKIIDLKRKRVYVSIDSSSIGDTVAWPPYLEEFRKKHDCILIASTFLNDLVESKYDKIKFVAPGEEVKDIYATYKIGYFHNENMEPEQCNIIPLQKAASNILGLDFHEIMPEINYQKEDRKIKEKYITIGTHSTAALKYWNNPTGWQETVDFLISEGYRVINTSREGCDIIGVENLEEYSIDNIMNTINYSDFFIGLGSGLSWLAWTLKKKVVMIANFTESGHEFVENSIRVENKSVCNSCWNKKEYIFDKSDWNWCPVHKGTDRQFECSKSITGKMVIETIKSNLLNKH